MEEPEEVGPIADNDNFDRTAAGPDIEPNHVKSIYTRNIAKIGTLHTAIYFDKVRFAEGGLTFDAGLSTVHAEVVIGCSFEATGKLNVKSADVTASKHGAVVSKTVTAGD